MGYRSEITIGMLKTQYLECSLITLTLPKLLVEHRPEACGEFMYWNIEEIKWYDSYADISECERFFKALDALPYEDKQVFGAIRLGESSDDIEEWGSPHEYDIYVTSQITSPLGH
tara:strand:+ start:60 stop:404 length:345 start_codon:yes stop_codon:yes gene_type:complete